MPVTAAQPYSPSDLAARWRALLAEEPRLRVRDAAARLGVTEAQLVALECGVGTTRLSGPFPDIVRRMHELGEVMVLTRNDSAVHEKRGTFDKLNLDGQTGFVVDRNIDLRLFFDHWHVGFAVREERKDGVRRSLQFFDVDGTAIHKVFLENKEGVETFEAMAEVFKADDQSPVQLVEPVPAPAAPRPDSELDVEGFRAAWASLQDTHDFFGLLRRFGVARTQALRLAEERFVRRLPNDTLRKLLELAASQELSIMVFVGSRGVIQIHTGPVSVVRPLGPWINVLDRAFNLHLREDHIAETWVVRKPTRDGLVTSLELFDANGENIALLFGERKPGKPESEAWRQAIALMEEAANA